MNKKQLKNQIEKKLDKLSQLLNNIDEAWIINPDDPNTWDSDTFYNLVESLKEALTLLEDKTIPGKVDDFNQPLTEAGLCSLMDDYQSEMEEEEEEDE